MSYKVKVPAPISQAIRVRGLPRELLVRLLNRLLGQLPIEADRFRHNRDPDFPECFRYYVRLVDGQRKVWHNCRFLVNDRQAGLLYIEWFHHEERPLS